MKILKKLSIFLASLFVVGIIFIITIYQLLAILIDNEFSLPKLQLIIKESFNLFSMATFWKSFFYSLFRTIIGFLLSFILALTLAIIHKFFKFPRKFINIIIAIIRAVPTIAIILNLLFWTNSNLAPIIIACLVTLPQLFVSILQELENFDIEIIQMCNLYKIPQKQIFLKVYMPFVMPRLALTICSNFALTLKLIGSSEALCSTLNSLGYMMKDAKASFNPSELMALSIICIIVAIVLEYSLKFVIKKVWRIK